jgi:hypothetical protein
VTTAAAAAAAQAHTDLSSPSHPVRILKEIAQPGDFVGEQQQQLLLLLL